MKLIVHTLAILSRSLSIITVLLFVASFPLQTWLNDCGDRVWFSLGDTPSFQASLFTLLVAFVFAMASKSEKVSRQALVLQGVFLFILLVMPFFAGPREKG